MRYLAIVVTLALAPMQAHAQCANEIQTAQMASAPSDATIKVVVTIEQRNAATMKAALGGDDSHATDADLE
jgi:hypothetical protein